MTSIRRISRCHGVQSNLYWIAPQGTSYDNEFEDHFDVQSLVLGNETSFNFTVLAVDNRISIWTYNKELYKNSFSTRELKIMPSTILSSAVQLRAIPRMSTEYGLARMIVLDNCNQLHIVGQLIIPVSFQPRLESRVAVVEVGEYSKIKLCLKKYLYTNLLENRKFPFLGISNFEKTISETHAKTLDSFFDVTKTWIEIGCDKQSINFKELPGLIAIEKKKQNGVWKEPLGFMGVQRLRFSDVLYFTPKLHYDGHFQLPFCLKYNNPFGKSVTIDTTLLQINVTRVKNAPTLPKPPSLQDLPTLTLGNQDPGRQSVEYTGPVFGNFGQTSMGMVVIHAQTSEFGQWEVRTPKSEKWNPLLTGKFFTPNNYKMGFISGEKFCTLHNFTMESYKPVLLNATDKLRFHSSANIPWWNTTQAKQNTLLIFSAWNMTDSLIPYGWPCFGQSSVSADLFMFSLEYRDCSGQNVVDKPLTIDACGVCNGDNMSCQNVVCSGVNSCDVCGTKFSGITIQRDCAGTCEQENALLTFGDHEVCVRRGEEQTIKLCIDSRNSTDQINGCEQCVGKVTGDDIDLCGICGGRNECVSCDGIPFSEFSIDECGKCLKNGDPQRNYCTTMEFLTYSMISTSSRKIIIIIKSPEDVYNMTLKCELFDKENNSYTEYISMKMHSSYQHDSGAWMFKYRELFTVKDHLMNYILFLVSCEVSINLTTGIHRLTAQKLFMWDLEMFVIKKITPSTIGIEENVKVTVEVENKTTSGLWCFYGTSKEMRTVSKAIILGPYSVQCDISATSTRNSYQLVIIPESKIVNNSTRISAYLSNSKAYIRPKAPAPLVIEAVITEELTEIRITFNINLYKRYTTCRDSFTSATLQQLGVNVPSCRMFGNFIFISLPSAFKYTSNVTVEFAETNFQYNPRGVVHVTLPHKTVKPILHVEGPEKVCSGMLQIHVSETVGGGVFGLNYKWSITSNHKVNLSTIFDVLERTTSYLEIPVEKLEPELTYVFSVYGENIIGVKSDTHFHSVMRINDQRMTVTIIGPDEVSIWAENTLVAEITWCSNVSHIHSLTYYWRVNSSDFHLPQEWGPVLRISKYMKGQTTYKFMVTVIDVISLEVLSQATHIVRTKEVPLVVRTGVLSLVVPYNQTFCLNGSGSYDPSKEQEPMYYRWMCSLKTDWRVISEEKAVC
ncbi:uncharacterized protein LOC143227212 [Tachypleus tridentatus]|uniref:uncharacterized protein LOC143227212 n=1 Tax=Tachypleus tridentatus TaxID=6853 RepID=UPI003FD35B30